MRFELRAVGVVRSDLVSLTDAPRQGGEGAPDAWLDLEPWAAPALERLAVGDELLVLTWLDRADRDILQTHPRNDPNAPLTGVFATRSPDRPNPIGLHPVTLKAIDGTRLKVGPLEAVDGTPIVDLKPVI
jgi:tRNA-Thr(GGU) m(6)t(6)A37 methyltransferase TsaA